jgi:hypothetical protein
MWQKTPTGTTVCDHLQAARVLPSGIVLCRRTMLSATQTNRRPPSSIDDHDTFAQEVFELVEALDNDHVRRES